MSEEIYAKMKDAVLEGEEDDAKALAEEALAQGLPLKKVMDDGFLAGIQEAGRLYSSGEYFLPDLMCSADSMKAALAVLEEEIKKPTSEIKSKGTVLMATVQGDVHDIGKVIVGSMLTAAGYSVTDLGVSVQNAEVVKAVEEQKPDFLALSALLTTTMEEQGRVIGLLNDGGIRGSVKVMVGGAPVTKEFGDKIGADGYSDDAVGAVALADGLGAS
ncbi:MAG: cobalamin-dependent protein [Clostridiales Family XIII bacterium]|jgi:corrinoid protein of di/trimethylamine methyltransferase|nr:cobalamin-dependent protein [Clostridiales Family XIII bacterium]